jgi:PII-like signaling protein
MKIEGDARLVTVYVNSTDQWHGRALYVAIVQLCQERGIAGATVTRCMEGYGAHRHLHTTRLLDLAVNLPVRIEIIDVAERIDALLPVLDTMIGEGLVTVQPVHTLKFIPGPRTTRALS